MKRKKSDLIKKLKRSAKAKAFKKTRREWRAVKGKAPLKDEAYESWIKTLPCFACKALGEKQLTPTDLAHIGEVRGLGQKCASRETGPLCHKHHRRGYTFSHHTLGKYFFTYVQVDRDELIKSLNARYDRMRKDKS